MINPLANPRTLALTVEFTSKCFKYKIIGLASKQIDDTYDEQWAPLLNQWTPKGDKNAFPASVLSPYLLTIRLTSKLQKDSFTRNQG